MISPINQGKESVVKHMLAIDWKFWLPYIFTSSAKNITIRMLERVAGISHSIDGRFALQFFSSIFFCFRHVIMLTIT